MVEKTHKYRVHIDILEISITEYNILNYQLC